MERIGIHNYELYVTDYLEGSLPADQEREMERFLNEYPHIRQEIQEAGRVHLVPEEQPFDDKKHLKKTLTLNDKGYTPFDEMCISRMEGEQTPAEARAFDRLLEQSPRRQSIYRLYEQTRLDPTERIVFRNKQRLKKNQPGTLLRPRTYSYMAMAASVLLIVALYIFLPSPDQLDAPDASPASVARVQLPSMATPGTAPEILSEPGYEDLSPSDIDYNQLSSQLMIEAEKNYSNASDEKLLTADKQDNIKENSSMSKADPLKDQVLPKPEANLQRMQALAGVDVPEGSLLARLQRPSLQWNDSAVRSGEYTAADKLERFLERRVNMASAENAGNQKFSLWDIAGAGLEGLSKLTGKELALERRYNNQGKLQTLALQTESFSLTTRLD